MVATMEKIVDEIIAFKVLDKKGIQAAKILSQMGDIANPKDWDRIVDRLLDFNVEICPNCKTWVKSYELLAYWTSEIDGFCDICRPEEKKLERI